MHYLAFLAGHRIEHSIARNACTSPGRVGLPSIAQTVCDSLALCLPRLYRAFSNSINRVELFG